MAVQMKLLTAEEFEQSPLNEKWVELVRGEVTPMSPTSFEHGHFSIIIGSALHEFVHRHRLGKVCGAETGFILTRNPDTVRAPDVSFVHSERVAQRTRKRGYFEGAPDLAVEVVSPGDRDAEVQEKVLEYLQAGTQMVWIVSPRTETVTVYRSLAEFRVLTREETLEGGDLLPGFQLRVREIFEE
jgi:Uma2 family endonuclease